MLEYTIFTFFFVLSIFSLEGRSKAKLSKQLFNLVTSIFEVEYALESLTPNREQIQTLRNKLQDISHLKIENIQILVREILGNKFEIDAIKSTESKEDLIIYLADELLEHPKFQNPWKDIASTCWKKLSGLGNGVKLLYIHNQYTKISKKKELNGVSQLSLILDTKKID